MIIRPATPVYKKCFKCGHIASNTEQINCKCGGFLYTVSQIYGPKIEKKK